MGENGNSRSSWAAAVGPTVLLLLVSMAPGGAQEPAPSSPPAEGAPARAEEGTAAASPNADRERFLRMWAGSYYPGRSGDIMLVPREGDMLTENPFQHGTPWDYDVHVPLVLYGPAHVRKGVYEEAVDHEDVGATLGSLLGLPARPVQTGTPLSRALRADAPRPDALVLLVLDGFGVQVLERYREELPVWRRLRRDGAWFAETRASVLPTATSVAHTGMSTATVPAFHGITGNNPLDRVRGRVAVLFEDGSPDHLTVLSVADRWSVATDGDAVIYAQGGTDYPAAALAGHGACKFAGRPVLMAYLDRSTGSWATNESCYALPDSLATVTLQGLVDEARAAEGGIQPTESRSVALTRFLPRLEGRASVTVVETEGVGADSVTDLVLLNWKTADYVGHAYGPGSAEMAEAVRELDREMGRLIEALDVQVGTDEYVLAVTADHGVAGEPPEERARHDYEELMGAVDGEFDPEGPGVTLFVGGADMQLYLDRTRLAELDVAPGEVARFLETLPYIAHAFTAAEVAEAQSWALSPDGP